MPKDKKTKTRGNSAKPKAANKVASHSGQGFARFLISSLVLAASVFLVYGRSINTPFFFDDSDCVIDNISIVKLSPLLGDSNHSGPLNPPKFLPTSGRPLVNLSLAINYYFGQFRPAGYHIFNIVVHILAAMLLAAIVYRTLKLDRFAGRFDAVAWPLSLIVALIWAVHPLQTETVVYVTQRTELLMGLFFLITLYCSLRYWTAPQPGWRNTYLAAAVLACLAGMACKEVMVTAPLLVFLFEVTFLTRSPREAWQRSWPLYVGLALGWILLFALNIGGPRGDTAGFHLGVHVLDWWLAQSKVLVLYLKLAFWPWPLSIHYPIQYLSWQNALPSILLDIVLFAGTVALLLRRNPIGYLGAWIFLILSPTLLVPIITEAAAERRMYLPLASLVILVFIGGYALVQRFVPMLASTADAQKPHRAAAISLLSVGFVLAIVLGTVSAIRLPVFNDDLTLWQETVASQPDDYLAITSLGLALEKRGHKEEAIEKYREALKINPKYTTALNGIAVALSETGHRQEAIENVKMALQIMPNYAEAHHNLAVELAESGREEEAVAEFKKAIQLKPNHPETYADLALTYASLNRPADALATADKAMNCARLRGRTEFIQQFQPWLNEYRASLSGSGYTLPNSDHSSPAP